MFTCISVAQVEEIMIFCYNDEKIKDCHSTLFTIFFSKKKKMYLNFSCYSTLCFKSEIQVKIWQPYIFFFERMQPYFLKELEEKFGDYYTDLLSLL